MTTVAVPRPHVGSGVELFASALTVPYAAGMRTRTVPLSGGAFAVEGPLREPVVLVRLRRPLADEAVVVRPTVGGDAQPQVLFGPFSAEGTMLPLFRPTLAAGSDGTGDITVAVTVHRVAGDQRYRLRPAAGVALNAAASAELVEALVMEGRFARLLYLGTLGGQRAIRMARDIAASRHRTLSHSRGLDDLGLGHGVPRTTGQPETDERYRSRLAIYTQWRLPTPAGFAMALNGPGEESDPNRGLPAEFGIGARFRIVEETNELALAVKLVAVGGEGETQLVRFHEALRAGILLDLEHVTSPFVPATRRQNDEAVRTNLRSQLTRPTGPGRPQFMTRLTATTLDRAVRLIRALGNDDKVLLEQAYDPTAGSRYELGLGVDLGAFSQAQLEAMADRVDDVADGEGELARLAQSLAPRSFEDDPVGRWLFEPCGFRTVQALSTPAVYLSPLPIHGQLLDGPNELGRGDDGAYRVRLVDSGGSFGRHPLAEVAAAAVSGVFADRGLAPVPPALSPDELAGALEALAGAPDSPPLPARLDAAAAAGVVTVEAKALAAQLVTGFNLDLVVGFTMSGADLTALGSGAALRDALIERIDALGEAGFYTVRSVWDGARLVLLAAVAQLPGAAGKVGEPPPAAYRWYTTRVPAPIPGSGHPLAIIQPRGGVTTVRGTLPGVGLLVCLSYARRGLADPFEVRVELPDPDTVLSLDQYGFVMNLLEHLYPLGIEINTFDIRRRHVDVDGDGEPEFLTSRASRSYHRYRHRRPFGAGRGRDTRGTGQWP